MKRYILLLAISVLAFASCSKDDNTPKVEERSGISLDVVCSTMAPSTKAVKPGEDAYNENIIKTIDYYFYPEGGTEQNAVLEGRVADVNTLNQYTVNVPIDEALLNTTLFPRPSDRCQVAVLVNYPGDHPTGNTKISDLEVLSLTIQLTDGPKPRGKDQSEFVMFGVEEVTLISRKATLVASEIVDVHRIACKITLDAYVAPSVIAPVKLLDGGVEYTLNQEWTPRTNEMYIYLENGVSNAFVSGDPEAAKPYNYFKYDQRAFTGEMATHNINGQPYQFHKSHPFYTYPQTWATADPKEPFLKLVLPWDRQPGDDHLDNPDWETKPHTWGPVQKQFYYRILLPHDATGFVSNNWYHINLDVAILGSDFDDASVEIEGKYWVVPWGEATPVEADIKGSRYLSVSQLNHTMYNVTDLKIPYVTSNKCSITSLSVRQYNFYTKSYTDYTNQATSGHWVDLDENNNIVIHHDLDNEIESSTLDVAPYEFSFRIRHEDSEGATYYKDITVLQYPALYITAETTTHNVFINRTSSSENQRQYPTGTNNYFLGSITARSGINDSGDNTNPRQYTVHATVLDNPDWVIGDPRVATGSSLSNLPTGTGTTGLSNYKPTADNVSEVIAPVFKIASSFGKSISISYDEAVRRCAAYQENGYPAGRWRLPTAAEIEFLVTLSDNHKIPQLFSASVSADQVTAYWAAGNLAYDGTNFTNMSSYSPSGSGQGERSYNVSGVTYKVYPRCVYDVWYWGDNKVANPDSWAGYND